MKKIRFLILLFSFLECSIILAQEKNICLFVRGIPNQIVEIEKSKIKETDFGKVRGRVLNHKDSLALKNVWIVVDGNFSNVTTDENGYFEIKLKEEIYDFSFINDSNRPFKTTIEVNNGKLTELIVYLGIDDSWVTFSTENPSKLKKRIKKQNRFRKIKY